MYKRISEAVEFVEKLKPLVEKADHCDVVVGPPFTALKAAADAAHGSQISVAAQDLHWDKEGAHTGDVSPAMILDAGCTYVIIGHSERRRDHGETDHQVNQKLRPSGEPETEGGARGGIDSHRLRGRNAGGARS